MYSESRVTRSKARTQGVSQFEELPLTSAKGRTTTKKPRERPAFCDVTNAAAEHSALRKEPSSPIQNLAAAFYPTVETDTAKATSDTASQVTETSQAVENAFGLNTVLPEVAENFAPLLHKAPTAETDTVTASDPDCAVQDAVLVQPVAGVDEDLFFAGDQGGTSVVGKEVTVTVNTIVAKDGSDTNAVTATQTPQSPLHKPVKEAPLSPQNEKDQELAVFAFNTSDVGLSAAIGSPKPCDSTPSASDLLSSTPATLRQPLLPDDLGTPAVPDTVIAGPTDVGYLLADSLTPKTAQSTALGAASVTTASPRQTLPNAVAPALGVTNAVGLLDAAYFSTEAGPEMIDAVNKSTEELFVASTSSPHKLAAPTEGKVQGVDTMVAMCLSEADAESAEDMGELSPFQHMCESPDSPHSSAVSGKDADDIGVPSDLMQSPLTLRQPSSPAVSVPHMPALDSSMASDAFGSPMQQVPASATRTARSSGTPYRVSPVCHDSHSVSDSAAGEDGTPLVAGKSSLVPDNTTGLDDRWQMEEETASVFSNTHVANMAATRVSSQVHASPSYDPRSLKQLKKEVADKLAKKAATKAQAEVVVLPPTPAGLYESESDADMSPGPVCTKQSKGLNDDELCNALGSLEIQSAGKSKEPLRGLPVPQGTHIRFDSDGQAVVSPSSNQTRLRGVPAPRNSHIRFD